MIWVGGGIDRLHRGRRRWLARAARWPKLSDACVAEAPRHRWRGLLFAIPAHMRARFWDMLGEQAAEGTGDFITFAADLRQFLVFKELPPPADATFDLLVQDAGGAVDPAGLWALVNFSDEPLLLDWPGVRLRLGPGEGCRIDPRSRSRRRAAGGRAECHGGDPPGRRRTVARMSSKARAKSSSRSRSSRSPSDC